MPAWNGLQRVTRIAHPAIVDAFLDAALGPTEAACRAAKRAREGALTASRSPRPFVTPAWAELDALKPGNVHRLAAARA